jgi:hypothetical protein
MWLWIVLLAAILFLMYMVAPHWFVGIQQPAGPGCSACASKKNVTLE